MNLNRIVEEAAREQGFAMAGFARVRRLQEREDFYRGWLADGRPGMMTYLTREPERRFDPRRLDARFKSVVSLAYPYAAPAPPRINWRAELRGRIAAYALGGDYHDYVLKHARAVADTLAAARSGTIARAYVDTGPVFEREWSVAANLGWFGRNTMLLSRERGSYFFLAEIFTDAELEPTAEPYGEFCGTCRRCLDLCPTGALQESYRMEPRLCISYLTIEHRGAIPRELRPKLGEWLFGCDICQEVCPWNGESASEATENPALMPYLPDILALDQAAFGRRFTKSAIKRTKRRGLLRNAAIVLGNTKNPDAVPPLSRALDDSEPIVRAHAAWALGNIGGRAARLPLERSRKRESDPDALGEINEALAAL